MLLLFTAVDSGIIVSPTIVSDANLSRVEENLVVTTLQALGTLPLTWSIIGGNDAALFDVDASSGELSFLVAPEFDNPQDLDLNNVYELTIQVSNAGGTDSLALQITVLEASDALQSKISFGLGVALGM